MRFKGLAALHRPEPHEIALTPLPQKILMARYAIAKAFKISELVREIHKGSYEWYGYTLAARRDPELILDIGLPRNDQNLADYTSVGPERIATYQESLSPDTLINGWIHSHGNLPREQFSDLDEKNQSTMLDYVASLLRTPVAKRAVVIRDLVMLVKDRWTEADLAKGSVSLITDVPIAEARIMETVYGGFCYSIVIGDDGWHKQEIRYRRRGILSGHVSEDKRVTEIVLVDTPQSLTEAHIRSLADEVRQKIQPGVSARRERYEKECT